MKRRHDIKLKGKWHRKGSEISWLKIYPFFLLHLLAFGGSGFAMAYAGEDVPALVLYLFGGFAILIYLILYLAIFGRDEVKWMFINSGLGLFGIYVEINWFLSFFGTTASDYPISIHFDPFLHYILYTYLIRQALLDAFNARENEPRKKIIEQSYIVLFTLFYILVYIS